MSLELENQRKEQRRIEFGLLEKLQSELQDIRMELTQKGPMHSHSSSWDEIKLVRKGISSGGDSAKAFPTPEEYDLVDTDKNNQDNIFEMEWEEASTMKNSPNPSRKKNWAKLTLSPEMKPCKWKQQSVSLDKVSLKEVMTVQKSYNYPNYPIKSPSKPTGVCF